MHRKFVSFDTNQIVLTISRSVLLLAKRLLSCSISDQLLISNTSAKSSLLHTPLVLSRKLRQLLLSLMMLFPLLRFGHMAQFRLYPPEVFLIIWQTTSSATSLSLLYSMFLMLFTISPAGNMHSDLVLSCVHIQQWMVCFAFQGAGGVLSRWLLF